MIFGAFARKCFNRPAIKAPKGHRNLKAGFSGSIASKKRFGLGQALDHLDLSFEGTAHRGIDDAKNIARVYKEILSSEARKNA